MLDGGQLVRKKKANLAITSSFKREGKQAKGNKKVKTLCPPKEERKKEA